MQFTYESEKERLNDELIYYMDKQEWPYLKECYYSYCNLEDDNRKRIVKLNKKIQSRKKDKYNNKDEVLLCASYFLNNYSDFCNSLSDDAFILYTEYYLYNAIINPDLGKDKKELFELACIKRKDLDSRMIIVQVGESLLNDRKSNYESVTDVCDFIKNTKDEELINAYAYYMNQFINNSNGFQIETGKGGK